ncbi:hypothetical protein Y032_0435g1406 [Ancylostoma ceylanicum]|uniref:G-protein coupled receptors family 1 profile domain-containing protein n=1 Tax=Ancylostoma ceylanicum TaxID=53326 RepID=A0A016WZF6_9BILA|nr:hypothetical protein Y032_0435g1406 [Ancylostoma ceylanicum]
MRCRLLIVGLILFDLISAIFAATSLRSIEPPRFLSKKSCRFTGGGCHCIIRVRGECCCKGHEVTTLPANLTTTVRVLVMFNVSIATIDSTFFQNYANLEEIEIYESPHLQAFDGNSLRHLTHLRKLEPRERSTSGRILIWNLQRVITPKKCRYESYGFFGEARFSITWCRKLEEISEVLLQGNLKIQSLILRDNGLKRMPSLEMTDEHKMDVEIDLSGNQIQYIGDGRVRSVRARSLRLNNNRIKEIAGYAFSGSNFLKLALNGNEELTDLSSDAFKGITELHHLDLSDTSISQLPIIGLKNLKTLALKNVPTLKKLPPVLSFTHLETAHFTYPHHCCLFKYVDDVVEGENGLYKNNAKEIHHRICKERETHRSRRQATNPPSNSDLWSNLFEQWLRDADELLDLGDEDPPAFDPSEIGATRCLAVEEVATVQGFYQNITCTPQPDAFNPCENIVGLWVLRRAIWPVCTAAIVGNVLVWVILALAFEKRMRVHYLFMINLAIADFTTGVYLAVLAVQDVRTGDEYYRHAVSWQTGWGCSMAGFFAVLSSELSITSMFFIAFEMAYNTRNAFYGQRLRFSVACAMMAGGWTFAITMASMPLLGVSSYSTASICLPLRLHNMADRAYLIFFLLFNLLAFIAMVVCYGFLMFMLKDPSTPSRAEDNLIIKKMVWLVGADFLCWFPTLFFGLSAAMNYPLISLSSAKFLLVFFFPINASANPFLYVFFTKIIQRNVRTKALPMIRRITSTSGVALNTLSNFYHSQPPGRREDVGSPTRLGVSQMTSLDSTPRGSNCSSMPTMDTDMPETPRRSSPRVSFQDNVSYSSRPSSDSTRPSFAWSKRISSIPEVSDLSEHSSESHHEHIPTQKKPRRSESQPRFGLSLNRFGFGRQRQSSGGVDSGRGSLASVSTRDTGERTSLASRDGGLIDTDSGVTSKLILPPSPSPNPVSLKAAPTEIFVQKISSSFRILWGAGLMSNDHMAQNV